TRTHRITNQRRINRYTTTRHLTGKRSVDPASIRGHPWPRFLTPSKDLKVMTVRRRMLLGYSGDLLYFSACCGWVFSMHLVPLIPHGKSSTRSLYPSKPTSCPRSSDPGAPSAPSPGRSDH